MLGAAESDVTSHDETDSVRKGIHSFSYDIAMVILGALNHSYTTSKIGGYTASIYPLPAWSAIVEC